MIVALGRDTRQVFTPFAGGVWVLRVCPCQSRITYLGLWGHCIIRSLTKVPDGQGKGQDDEHESDDTQHPDDHFLAARGSGIEHHISG